MGDRTGVRQGTLALMESETLKAMGRLHGYGIARRSEREQATAILERFFAPLKES